MSVFRHVTQEPDANLYRGSVPGYALPGPGLEHTPPCLCFHRPGCPDVRFDVRRDRAQTDAAAATKPVIRPVPTWAGPCTHRRALAKGTIAEPQYRSFDTSARINHGRHRAATSQNARKKQTACGRPSAAADVDAPRAASFRAASLELARTRRAQGS